MIRALMNHALLFALLGGWLGVTQAAADPELASEVSDVATLPPNPPHRFFTGGFREHSFVIFDADTGKEVWTMELPASAQSTPMTYTWEGKQYIVIGTSNAKNRTGPQGAAYVVFALP